MKKIQVALLFVLAVQITHAQDWKTTGNNITNSSFLGSINCYDLVFKTNNTERGRITSAGIWRFGKGTPNAQFDLSGNLSFYGGAAYRVTGNSYVFRYSNNLNYGLYFNSTVPQYEFRNGSAVPVFYVNANTGNGVFRGTLKIGAYTFPSADGTNGQVLKTNGAGTIVWSTISSAVYTAGPGIGIAGNVISNTGDLNGADDANLFLSNLSSPTAVNQSLLPDATNTRDFGSSGLSWRDLYSNGTLYLNGEKYLSNPFPGTGNILLGPGALAALTSGVHNVAVGTGTLANNTTGSENTATGFNSLNVNTAGSFNTAAGSGSLSSNQTGSNNTAIGVSSLYFNTTGGGNTASGVNALFSNTAGSSNTGTGHNTLYTNTTGSLNTAAGANALLYNTSGSNNTSTGAFSLFANSTGSENTATGVNSLSANTTGSFNTATGNGSLGSNTTGDHNTATGNGSLGSNTTGNYNTGTGRNSLAANTTGHENTATGVNSLAGNTTGFFNTATGNGSLSGNTTGSYNSAMGGRALISNTTGTYNTAVGFDALKNNTTGNENTAAGVATLAANTTGTFNTATGYASLTANTTGTYNTAVGSYALNYNTTGNENTAAGVNSLAANTIGSFNTATGNGSLAANTTGDGNTATGYKSLIENTTGGNNTATGSSALRQNTSGAANTAVGYFSLVKNEMGNYNSATGEASLYNNIGGYNNTGNGYFALASNVNGFYLTALGSSADVSVDGLANATAIGYNAVVDASNKVRIGNTNVTSIGGQVGWTTFSDGRYKRDIKENVQGLAFIRSLRPVTYTVDLKSLDGYLNKGRKNVSADNNPKGNPDGITGSLPLSAQSKSAAVEGGQASKSAVDAGTLVQTGFIAQEVEASANKFHYNFSGVDKPKTSDGLYGLRYDQFVVPLVKAVQELAKMNDTKNARIDVQQKQIDDLEQRLSKLETKLSQHSSLQNIVLSDNDEVSLQQNVPNPFARKTVINYTLPQKFTSAQIIITDKSGKTLKQVKVEGAGKGSLNIDASTIASGAYNYSLYVDGKLIGSRQMIFTK